MAASPHTPSGKPEFPPLLSPGFHLMTLDDVTRLCVDEFPLSTTRAPIMDGIAHLCETLDNEGIQCDAWLDGSFLTQKIDPRDVDVVFRILAEFLDRGSPHQRRIIEWATHLDRYDTHKCDTYAWLEHPPGHRYFPDSKELGEKWAKWFGESRGGVPKGIAVVQICGGV